jgi:hypothetical protein
MGILLQSRPGPRPLARSRQPFRGLLGAPLGHLWPAPVEETLTDTDSHGHRIEQLGPDAGDAQLMLEAASGLLNLEYGPLDQRGCRSPAGRRPPGATPKDSAPAAAGRPPGPEPGRPAGTAPKAAPGRHMPARQPSARQAFSTPATQEPTAAGAQPQPHA